MDKTLFCCRCNNYVKVNTYEEISICKNCRNEILNEGEKDKLIQYLQYINTVHTKEIMNKLEKDVKYQKYVFICLIAVLFYNLLF